MLTEEGGYALFLAIAMPPVPGRSRPSCSIGGAEEIRTPDLRRAKAALSQLSYGPSRVLDGEYATDRGQRPSGRPGQNGLVGHSGLEPETSVLSGLRSNLLS